MSPALDQYEFSMESCREQGSPPLFQGLCWRAPPHSHFPPRSLWFLSPALNARPSPYPARHMQDRMDWETLPGEGKAFSWSISKPCTVPSGKVSPYVHRARVGAGHTRRSNCHLQILPGPYLLMADMSNSSGFLGAQVSAKVCNKSPDTI